MPQLCHIAWELLLWCLQYDITIQDIHNQGVYNAVADALSCNQEVHHFQVSIDAREWSLHPGVVIQVFTLFRTLEVELFASSLNHNLPRWFSWYREPQPLALNAFSQKWSFHQDPQFLKLVLGKCLAGLPK